MPRESAWEGFIMFCSKKAAATMAGASVLGLYHFALADIQNYADSVVDFSAGTGAPAGYDTPASATGFLNGDTSYGGLNPFNPAFLPSDIVVIGGGGQLTLHTALPVPTNGYNLGVYSNNGITDTDPGGTGIAGSPPALFSTPNEAVVSVSRNGVNFVPLNGGQPIVFDAPANYYLDTPISEDFQALGSVVSNQSLPWLGNLASLSGDNYAAIKSSFNGSSGGNWLNLSSSNLPDINYIRFDVPAGQEMAVDAIGALHEAAPAVAGQPIVSESVGAGVDTSTIRVDFGPQSYDFQVHYNTPISGEQAIGLLAADTDLQYAVKTFSFGDELTSLSYGGYDLTGNGTGGTGFWEYYLSSDAGADWTSSTQGFTDRMLSNGSYDGWSFSSELSGPPVAPIAVPEPGGLAVLGLGGLMLRRRGRAVR